MNAGCCSPTRAWSYFPSYLELDDCKYKIVRGSTKKLLFILKVTSEEGVNSVEVSIWKPTSDEVNDIFCFFLCFRKEESK